MTAAPTIANAPDASRVRERTDVLRQVRLVAVYAVATVVLVLLALSIDDPTVVYTLGERVSREDPPSPLDAHVVAWVSCAVLLVGLVAAVLNRVPRGWAGGVVHLVAGLAFYAGFIVWYFADQTGPVQFAITNPLPQTVAFATPLVLGALAGVVSERTGVINIAIEGQFLMGAFFASVASSLAYSAEMGLLGGILAGVALSALLAAFALHYQVDQIILGVVLVTLALGLTTFLLGQIPGSQENPTLHGYLNEPVTLERIEIPVLSEIPVVGPGFFRHTLLAYLMFGAVVLVTVLLYKTRWGLRVRAVGEHPRAADTVGVKVNRIRWSAVLLGGALAGLGGAFYTVGSTGAFDANPSNGQGFIALAAMIMGRWHPIGATGAAFFFAFMLASKDQLSVLARIPSEALAAAPYLITVIAVAGFVGRVRPPAANGQPYVRS